MRCFVSTSLRLMGSKPQYVREKQKKESNEREEEFNFVRKEGKMTEEKKRQRCFDERLIDG